MIAHGILCIITAVMMKTRLLIIIAVVIFGLLGFSGAVLAKNLSPAQIQSIRNQLSVILNKLESVKSELKSIKDKQEQKIPLPLIENFAMPSPPLISRTLKIESISPNSGRPNTLVTLMGSGFTSDMILYSGFNMERVSSDGQAVNFLIASGLTPDISASRVTVPISIYLENSTGLSNEIIFDLNL